MRQITAFRVPTGAMCQRAPTMSARMQIMIRFSPFRATQESLKKSCFSGESRWMFAATRGN